MGATVTRPILSPSKISPTMYHRSKFQLIITRKTLGPPRWTISHKQDQCPRGQAMHRRIVSPAPTKLCLRQAPSSKLWTGETDMKVGHLKHLVSSVIDLDEISAQCTSHTNTSWYCGGREGENFCEWNASQEV